MDNKLIVIIGIILVVGIVLSLIKKVVKLAIVIGILAILLSGNFAIGKGIEEKIKDINVTSIENIKEQVPEVLSKYVTIEKLDDVTKVNIKIFLYEKTIELK